MLDLKPFREKIALLAESYNVESTSDPSMLGEFVAALGGERIAINDETVRILSALRTEFGLTALQRRITEFAALLERLDARRTLTVINEQRHTIEAMTMDMESVLSALLQEQSRNPFLLETMTNWLISGPKTIKITDNSIRWSHLEWICVPQVLPGKRSNL